MPALSFSVFRDKILDGSKRQTIRSARKRAIAAGDKLFLYWKQQSPKDCEKLGKAICIKSYEVEIHKNYLRECDEIWQATDCTETLDNFAKDDGFDNWQQMIEYFDKNHGLPFRGVLIQWDALFPL